VLTAWRLVKTRLAATAFDGEGARLFGGRWSGPGTRVVYASDTLALAALEVLANLQDAALLVSAYSAFRLTIPKALAEELDPEALPGDWMTSPAPAALRDIGDAWVRAGRSAVIRVPSAIVRTEWNLLLNPAHRRFGEIIIGPRQPFAFDPRFRKR
jgi:RES domain-containing protein